MSDAPSALLARVPVSGVAAMRELVELIAADEHAPTTVRDPAEAWRTHVLDSLSGLEIPALRDGSRIADVGAGAGFPGMALAAARPDAHVDLIEATARKCEFMRSALERARIPNARVVNARAEEWGASRPPDGGRGDADVVTARAVGRLATLAELASPLLREGGTLVAWKGRRDPAEEAEAERAAERLAMRLDDVRSMAEAAGFEHRHLYVLTKSGPTPPGLPRRPGMAKKRPFGGQTP
ncbi:MAG: 16S rRNA (guanine(527)-N(7))-methyltransferase RsmG [Solirubrobacterales bacterium]